MYVCMYVCMYVFSPVHVVGTFFTHEDDHSMLKTRSVCMYVWMYVSMNEWMNVLAHSM